MAAPDPWDGFHPTPSGTYLSAAVLYATLFGQSPSGASAQLSGHPMEDGDVDTTKSVVLASLGRIRPPGFSRLPGKRTTH
jgi:hypothetical protein